MIRRWIRRPASLALGLLIAMAGCSDGAADKDIAVVEPDPSVPAETKPKTPPATKAEPEKSAAAATAPVKLDGWGTLRGRVTFDGTPPTVLSAVLQAVGKAETNPDVCARTVPIVAEKLVVDPASKGVRNVFVYLQRPGRVNDEAKEAALARHPVFDQKNCTFIPHALAVMTGQTVTLRSSDPVSHNVNFRLRNLNQNPILGPGTSQDITPTTAERGPGEVACNVHGWMTAYWLVLDHPYATVTDKDGRFEIPHAPAGTQNLVAWQETSRYLTAPSGDPIIILPDKITDRDFRIDPATLPK